MLLVEFENTNVIDIVAHLIQARNEILDTGYTGEYKLSALIDSMNDSGIDISPRQFKRMIENPPLNGIVSGIDGGVIKFVGVGDEDEEDSESSLDDIDLDDVGLGDTASNEIPDLGGEPGMGEPGMGEPSDQGMDQSMGMSDDQSSNYGINYYRQENTLEKMAKRAASRHE